MRKITMKWTNRNIARLTRLFSIEYDFSGSFRSRLGTGHKIAIMATGFNKSNYIMYVFHDVSNK